MTAEYIFQVVFAFVLIGVLLAGMTYVARALQRGRLISGTGRRLVSTVESTMLAQNVAVHVVKVADKYFLLGGGPGGIALISELSRDEIEPYIEAQRLTLAKQRASLLAPFTRFKKS